MNEFLEILEKMGANDILHRDALFYDEAISFRFGGKKIEISGYGHNDETGGLIATVEDWPITTLDKG